jgi:transposase
MAIHHPGFTDLPISYRNGEGIMFGKREIACGVDVHNKFILATILSSDGLKLQDRFNTNLEDLLKFKNWLKENGCHKVALESTGNYWLPIYHVLEGSVEFILANAYQIKHIPGRKTDTLDSEWIAEICLKNLISPSRIFSRDRRELRSLTRSRESLIKMRTRIKNRITHELEAACIKLSSKLSDIFGKSGRHIVDGLLNGLDPEKILECLPLKRIKATKDEIRGVIQSNLSPSQIFLIQSHLNMIDGLTKQIEEIDSKISCLISLRKEDLRIALSMPGMGIISASTILAEIGDFRDFSSSNKLATYCGLVPSVYQSAGKLINGHITKHGSPHIRAMIIQVAHAIIRSKQNSRLKKFFLRIKARRGTKIGIVALARKVLCILYHLLICQEIYQDDLMGKPRCAKGSRVLSTISMSLDEMIQTIIKAGYEVRKNEFLESGSSR